MIGKLKRVTLVSCLLVGFFTPHRMVYGASYARAHRLHSSQANVVSPVVFGERKFPYPYDSMLAISSDADHETLRKFNLIHEFVNTTEMTPMGKGLGLDFADSMFMYNGSNLPGPVDNLNAPLSEELTYFRGVSDKPYQAPILNLYIHGGWIDTLHSLGDFSMENFHQTRFSRNLAVLAVDDLKANHDVLSVWTDHGNSSNVDDFGSFDGAKMFWYQQGANPWSPYYITDLLIPYGVHFVWADLPSDQFGYYSIIYPKHLPDGQKVWGFWRYTNTSFDRTGEPTWAWTGDDLDQELTIQNLLHIEYLHQYAIVAQHLSSNNDPLPLAKSSVLALQLLASQYHDGHILVARTSRLLQYNVAQKYVRYTVSHERGKAIIDIRAIADPVFGTHVPVLSEVRGLTFYTSSPRDTVIEIFDAPIPEKLIQYNSTDGNHTSIEIKWFPADTTNYAKIPKEKRHHRAEHPVHRHGIWGWIQSILASIGLTS